MSFTSSNGQKDDSKSINSTQKSVTFQKEDFEIDKNLEARDDLLSKYEEKMGDYLRVQQELSNVKIQLTDSLHVNRTLDKEYQTKIQSLHNQISELEAKNYELSQQQPSIIKVNSVNTAKLIKKCQELEQNIKDKNIVIEKHQGIIEKHEETIERLEKELLYKIEELKKVNTENMELNFKLNDYNYISTAFRENEVLLAKLKEENVSLHQQVIRLNKQLIASSTRTCDVQEFYEELQRQLKDLTDRYEHLLNQFNDCKQNHERDKDIYQELVHKHKIIADENKNLKEVVDETSKCLKRSQKTIANYKENINEMLTQFPSVTSLTELAQVVKRIPEKEKEARKQIRELRREMETLNQKSKEAEMLKDKNTSQDNKIKMLMAETMICKSFINMHNRMYDEMLEMTSKPDISLRHIIITIVMIKRWSSLHAEEEKLYTKGSNNWWWITSKDNSSPLESIKIMLKHHKELESENDNLKNLLNDANIKIETLEKHEDEKNINENLAKQFLQKQVEDLNNELSNVVNKDEYEKRTKLYYEKKQALRAMKIEVSELKKLKDTLNDKIVTLSGELQQKEERCEMLEQKLDDALLTVNDLQEQLTLSWKAHSIKQKEILSMERGIIKNEEEKKQNDLQIKAIVTENERLYNQIKRKKAYNNDFVINNSQNGINNQKCLRTLL